MVGFAAWALNRTMSNHRSEPATREELENLPPDPSAEDLGYSEYPGVGAFTTEDGTMVVYDGEETDAWIQSDFAFEWDAEGEGGGDRQAQRD